MLEINGDKEKEKKKETLGGYIGNVILCMFFPFMVLWYGLKYPIKGEYLKGILIILIVIAELIIVNSIYDFF